MGSHGIKDRVAIIGMSCTPFREHWDLSTDDLEASWEKLYVQIEQLIQNNTELQAVIKQIRKAKVRGTAAEMKGSLKSGEKIINIQDFLQPK